MNEPFDYPRTAQMLTTYFTRQTDSPGYSWAAGKAAAQGWLRLIQSGAVTSQQLADVDQLVQSGENDTGTAWIELRLAYSHWRKTVVIQEAARLRG